ncbi:MAG: M23 family metallopeptidase [Firmicutes bacterium]|nr:M23 family metallopeptidase [Bacillota bacterium]
MANKSWNWEEDSPERLYLPEPGRKWKNGLIEKPHAGTWYKTAICLLLFLLIWSSYRGDFPGAAGVRQFTAYIYSIDKDLSPYLKTVGEKLINSEKLRSALSQRIEEPAAIKPVTTMRVIYPVAEGRVIGYSQASNQYALSIQCQPGQVVRAPQAGRVSMVSGEKVNGYTVQIDHGNGFVSILASFSESWVKPDDQVQSGQTVGKLSPGGNNVLLTYRMTYQGLPVDPLNYLNGK